VSCTGIALLGVRARLDLEWPLIMGAAILLVPTLASAPPPGA